MNSQELYKRNVFTWSWTVHLRFLSGLNIFWGEIRFFGQNMVYGLKNLFFSPENLIFWSRCGGVKELWRRGSDECVGSKKSVFFF